MWKEAPRTRKKEVMSCHLVESSRPSLTTVRLEVFVCLMSYFILASSMRKCLGKHSCMSSQFPIAILNGISSFLSLVQENINMPSRHYYRLCS